MLKQSEAFSRLEDIVRRWIREEIKRIKYGTVNIGDGTYTVDPDGTFILNGVRVKINGWDEEKQRVEEENDQARRKRVYDSVNLSGHESGHDGPIEVTVYRRGMPMVCRPMTQEERFDKIQREHENEKAHRALPHDSVELIRGEKC